MSICAGRLVPVCTSLNIEIGDTWLNSAGWSRCRSCNTPLAIAASSPPPVHTAWPFLPMTMAVPVSWHIGSTPPAAMLAFFRSSSATYLSFDRGLAVVEDRGAAAARWPGRSRWEMSWKAWAVSSVSASGSTVSTSRAVELGGADDNRRRACGRTSLSSPLREHLLELELGHGVSWRDGLERPSKPQKTRPRPATSFGSCRA